MEKPNAAIVVGGVIERNGEYLLVQEAKVECRGKWNLPAGHLDIGEDILSGALREVREEAGCEVELTGVCQIGSRRRVDCAFVAVIFTAQILQERVSMINPAEIIATAWFSYEEILAMQEQIRNRDLLIGAIDNCRQGVVAPLGIVKIYLEGQEFQKVMVK